MTAPYDLYDYQQYWESRSFEDRCEKLALKKFFEKISIKSSLIDIGGGYGRLVSFYASFFKKIVVIEPSVKLIKEGEELNKNFNVRFVQGSLPNLPSINSDFDVALMIRVSHHLENLLPSFKNVAKLVKKDSFFILEIANKVHFLAKLRAWLKGDFFFAKNTDSVERRSEESIRENKITFVNHHPQKVLKELGETGFKVVEILSVSNFRSPLLKKIFPEKALLWLENTIQKPLAGIFFGPSIFVLAKKTG